MRFRPGFVRSDGTFSPSLCEARSAHLRPGLKLNVLLAAFHRPLSHGLNLIQLHERKRQRCLWNKHPRSPAKPLREATVLLRSLAQPTLPRIQAPRSPPRSFPSNVKGISEKSMLSRKSSGCRCAYVAHIFRGCAISMALQNHHVSAEVHKIQ